MAKDIRVALRLDTADFDRGMRSAQSSVQGLGRDITGLLGAVGIGLGVREIIAYTSQWQELQNRIRATFETTNEQVRAFGDIRNIASETRSSLADVADLYTKVKIAGDSLKLTQTEIAQVTETFTKALKASGAGAAQSSAAILQFGQALASGRLQGDEFRSLMENAPVFMRALSTALNKPIGELRDLAKEGAITSDVILAATQEMADGIDDKFAQTIPTINDAFTEMQNTIMEQFGRMEESTGNFGKLFKFVGENIIGIIKTIGVVMAATFGMAAGRALFAFGKALVDIVKIFRTLRSVIAGAAAAEALFVGISGVGLAAVAAAGVAATAAYVGLNALFDESDAAVQDNINQYNALQDSLQETTSATRQTAEAALAAGQARSQAEKDATKAAREAAAEARRIARERERDLERARDQLTDIRENIRASQEQAALDARRLFTSKEEADLQQLILDIQKERRRQLAEITKLERLTPAERTAQEQQINALYDERLQIAKEVAMSGVGSAMAFETGNTVRQIRIEARAYAASVEERKALLTTFNEFDRRITEEQIQLRQQYRQQLEQEEFESLQRIANYNANGMTEAAQREAELSAQRIANIRMVEGTALEAVKTRINAERQFYEENRSFAQGWAEAYGEYFENLRRTVEDQAGYAKRIFNTITDGFTNSIMKFVETGKLSFKDLFKTLMAEIIKMQVNKLFLSIFGKGGPMGSLFAGLFADGGTIPAGKYGIAGEAGPELIRGPANVISTKDTAAILGGSTGASPAPTMVTYNINATDARSFKELVAADPAFIYNVTTLGARRIPR